MSNSDRLTALEILGFGSAPKLLANPYSLGGYHGVELGITTEVIPTTEIATLGNKTSTQSEMNYSLFTLGKGLFNNVDARVQFGLLGNSEDISNFGGQLSWTFFEGEYVPTFLTLVWGVNSVNYQNLITTNTQVSDLIMGVNVDDLCLYLGAGIVRTQGYFVGGASGVTSSGDSVRENLYGGHYVAGLSFKLSELFFAMEIDRYSDSTFSAKAGFRF